MLKKGSSCLFWSKLSETFSDPYCILVYEILLTITKYVHFFFRPQLQGNCSRKVQVAYFDQIKWNLLWSVPKKLRFTFEKPGVFCLFFNFLIFFRTSTENYLSYWWMRDIYSKLPYQYRKNLKGKITCDHKIHLHLFWLIFFARKCGWL